MPAKRFRSRTLRRVFRRSPSGVSKLHYRNRATKRPQCSNCNTILAGVARLHPSMLKHTAKTHKRAQRPYGGVLCSACMRRTLISKARTIGEQQ